MAMNQKKDHLRPELLGQKLKTIVVKIGSQSFTLPPSPGDSSVSGGDAPKGIFSNERVDELAQYLRAEVAPIEMKCSKKVEKWPSNRL
jgi:hypothetical protein